MWSIALWQPMNPEIFDVNLPVNIMHILYEDDYDDGVDDDDDASLS